jgi:RND family efflux transporter MFP subunit
LARFEANELQAKVNERQSALDAARADARWTARDRSDKETLANRNIVSQSAADQARAVSENKASMVAVAEAQLEVAKRNLADAEVRAPFDGVVGERIANQGESLPIDGKILALLDTSHVEVAAQMPAADVVRLKVDQPATVTLEGFGEREFRGRIMRISPTAQPGSRSIPVYVEITDRHESLRGGLFATGSVSVAEKGHALAVPAAAMRKDDQGDYVLAVENGMLLRKPVGAVRTWSRGELVEVKGLEAGMTVVSAPLPGLKAGQPVKVVETR